VVKLLIVEDEQAISAALRRGLEFEGYEVATASNGQAALRAAARERPDVIILDVMLPKLGGVAVCERLREQKCEAGIIMLTARDQEADKVIGLRAGADDYLTKPFSFLELLARVEALLRRRHARDGREPATASWAGRLTFDGDEMVVRIDGRPLDLSRVEYRILRYFVEREGETVTRDELIDAVWGDTSEVVPRTVDIYVAKLRKKIEDDPANPRHLVTYHGMGYTLRP
jgi:DNA-binding response OmpR family regulator